MERSSAHKRFGTGAVICANNRGFKYGEGWSHVSHIRHASTFSLHAEIHALARARYRNAWIMRNDTVIYIATVRKPNQSIGNGKPCLSCAIALAAANIRYAIYSTNGGNYEVFDLRGELRNLKEYPFRAVPV